MSDQQLFKNYFLGKDGFNWWVGQIASDESWKANLPGRPVDSNEDEPGFGERYKVRIMGHVMGPWDSESQNSSSDPEIIDDQLPWATVMYPVTAGGGPGASYQSANLVQGTYVFGFFLDGEDGQTPIIIGTLGYNDYNKLVSDTKIPFVPQSGFTENVPWYSIRPEPRGDEEFVKNYDFPINYNYGEVIFASAQGSNSNVDEASREEDEDGQKVEPLETPNNCKDGLTNIQLQIQNLVNEINRIKKSAYSYKYALAQTLSNTQALISQKINEYAGFIVGYIKNIINEVRKGVINTINSEAKKFYNFLFPPEQALLKEEVEKGNELIDCLFRKIIDSLLGMVVDFLTQLVDKVVNVVSCVVDNFLGGLLGQLAALIDNVVGQVFGSIKNILNGITGIVGTGMDIASNVLGIISDVLSFLKCETDPECPTVDKWSTWGGASSDMNIEDRIDSLVEKIGAFSGTFTDAINPDNFDFTIDFDKLFDDTNQCFAGPELCGPPTLNIFGSNGSDFSGNVVVGQNGSILGIDIVNAGVGYVEDTIFGKISDNCGNGRGAVVTIVTGTVINPDGTPDTGIVDVVINNGGTGYLPSPNGSTGGGGQTWAESNDTVIQLPNGDYETPIPPGNVVEVNEDYVVTLPNNTNVVTSSGETIVGGRSHVVERNGTFTTPTQIDQRTSGQYPSDETGAYPVILYLCNIRIDNTGINYSKNDKVVIEPSNGATAVPEFDNFGKLTSIKVTSGGEGFTETPTVTIETQTGFNAQLTPVLCIDRIGEDELDKPITGDLVTVIDCVGRLDG